MGHLVACARDGGGDLLTYGNLAKKMRLHHRSTSWFLGVVQDYCADEDLPPLQALVVNKETMLPGAGYTGSERAKKLHQVTVDLVRSYAWPDKAPF